MRIVFLFIFLITATVTRADDAISLQQIYDINLTVLEIETVNGEMPVYEGATPPDGVKGYAIKNATKVPGRLRMMKGEKVLYDSEDYLEDVSGMTIRIRGNTTAWAKKKPYKIKLQKKADLLLRGDDAKYSDKDWLLILDESLSAKTGFIFEFDAYWWNESVYVESSLKRHPMNYTFKYPDENEFTEETRSYFTEMIHQVESSIKDGTYADYIDVNSFVTWLLAQDILGNMDAGGSNFYLSKFDNSDQTKVAFALLWDFDMIFVCQEQWGSVHEYRWFVYEYLLSNEAFIKAYIAKWNELSPTIFDQLFSYLEDYATSEEAPAFDQSVELDNQLWDEDRRTASERTRGIIAWLTRRKAWMNQAVEEMSATVSGIHSVIAHPDTDDVIYNLQGQRVSIPQKGIYLRNGKKYIAK